MSAERRTFAIGDRVRLQHPRPYEGEITWTGDRTVIVTRELQPGSLNHWRKNPQTPLVGHPWTASIEVPVEWLEAL